VGPALILVVHHTATDKCLRGHRHTLVGMYDQTRKSESIQAGHYLIRKQCVAIDHDLRNQKRQTCQGVSDTE